MQKLSKKFNGQILYCIVLCGIPCIYIVSADKLCLYPFIVYFTKKLQIYLGPGANMNVCNVHQTILYDASYLVLWWQILIQQFLAFHSLYLQINCTEKSTGQNNRLYRKLNCTENQTVQKNRLYRIINCTEE